MTSPWHSNARSRGVRRRVFPWGSHMCKAALGPIRFGGTPRRRRSDPRGMARREWVLKRLGCRERQRKEKVLHRQQKEILARMLSLSKEREAEQPLLSKSVTGNYVDGPLLHIDSSDNRAWMLSGRARVAEVVLSRTTLRVIPHDVQRDRVMRETVWFIDDIVGARVQSNLGRRYANRGLPEGMSPTVVAVVAYPRIPAYCACCVRGPSRAGGRPAAEDRSGGDGVPVSDRPSARGSTTRVQPRARRELRLAFARPADATNWQRAITRLARGLPVHAGAGRDAPVQEEEEVKSTPDDDSSGIAAGTEDIAVIPPVPRRRLLCVINPVGGPGRAGALFRRIWRRILDDACVEVVDVMTTHAGHGLEIAGELSLEQYDGLVAVGGDGMLHELVQGLLARPDWRQACRMPLGHLPGGSGNGVSRSIVEAADEVADWVAPAFLIAKGGVTAWDCGLVLKEDETMSYTPPGAREPVEVPKRYFSTLFSCAWGIVSDLDIESENCRCCGDLRFTFQGLVRAVCLRWYRGRFSFLRATTESESTTGWGSEAGDGLQRNGDRASKDDTDAAGGGRRSSGWGPGPGPQPRYLRPLDEPVPEDWEVRDGVFTCLWVLQTTHQSKDAFAAPNARFDDGVMYAVIVKETNFWSMMQILMGFEDGSYANTEGSEVIPIRAFRLEPETAPWGGYVEVDGEAVRYGPIQAEVFPGMLQLITGKPNLGVQPPVSRNAARERQRSSCSGDSLGSDESGSPQDEMAVEGDKEDGASVRCRVSPGPGDEEGDSVDESL